MSVDRVGGVKSVPQKIEPPKEKPQPQEAPAASPAPGGDAKAAEVKQGGANVAYALNANLPADQAAKAKPTAGGADPYANQTAEQIAKEQTDKYNNADDKQKAAEETGRVIADIARYDPAKAREVSERIVGDKEEFDQGGILRGQDKDELSQAMVDSLSDDELKQIAQSPDGQKLLEQMQRHLLAGNVHGDEQETANRAQTALKDTRGVFSDWYPGAPASNTDVPPDITDPNADPAEIAAYLKGVADSSGGLGGGNLLDSASREFIRALDAHKDDAQWLNDFYGAMGTEATARFINARTLSGLELYNGGFENEPDKAESNAATIRQTLEKAGLSQTDMNNLVNELSESGSPYPATEIFGKSTDNNFKEMFVRAAAQNTNPAMAAAGTQVLADMPLYKQTAILNSLAQDGQLNQFIQNGMMGEKNYTVRGSKVKFGGVEKLLANANSTASIPYPPYSQANFSPELQRNLFNAASQGLDNPQAFDNFEGNKKFKDNLSKLFINNRDQILWQSQYDPKANDKNTGVMNPGAEKGLERFFQLTLMTPPQGDSYKDLSASVFTLFDQAKTELSNPALANKDSKAYQDFIKNHNGMTPEDYAQLTGSVLGNIVDATGYAQESINKDEASRKATIEFFTGLAGALVPGVGGKIASGIGSEIFKHFVEKGVDYVAGKAQDGALDYLTDLINKSLGGEAPNINDMNELAGALYNEILRALPSGDAPDGNPQQPTLDLQSKFDQGFDRTSRYTRFDKESGG